MGQTGFFDISKRYAGLDAKADPLYWLMKGLLAMGGQMVDDSIVPVLRQRNSREENAAIKAGETPEGWADKPAKTRQKDTDARWTKKHGTSRYGHKNHVNVDRRHKLIRRYEVSDAATQDSQALDERDLKSRIHRKAHRNRLLSKCEQQGNKTRSKVRALVEHMFGAESNDLYISERGRHAGAQHRDRARQSADRTEEPGLQHAPRGPAGRAGRRPRANMSGMTTRDVRLECR